MCCMDRKGYRMHTRFRNGQCSCAWQITKLARKNTWASSRACFLSVKYILHDFSVPCFQYWSTLSTFVYFPFEIFPFWTAETKYNVCFPFLIVFMPDKSSGEQLSDISTQPALTAPLLLLARVLLGHRMNQIGELNWLKTKQIKAKFIFHRLS